jgi:ATP-dependent RNA helicase DeaD
MRCSISGFREDLEFLLDAAPPERRTLMFSATIPKDIANLAKRYQRHAVRIVTTTESEPHADIDYRAFPIAPNDVESAVVNVLRYFEMRGALVFCSTRESVRELSSKLLERGFAVVALSGELSQSERTHALQALRDGRARVCVATDVAARGIDLPDLGLVVHADLPKRREQLLHRSGRTGRAGRKGICVLLVPHTRRRQAERLLASANLEATWAAPPGVEAIRARDRERLVQDPAWGEEPSEETLAVARALLAEHSAEAIAAVLVRRHWERLPAPEELLDGRGGSDRAPPGAPAKARHERPRRHGLVPHEHRAPAQRRSALAGAPHLPARPCHQPRDRRYPHFRPGDQVRDRAARGGPLRHRHPPRRQRGPGHPHRGHPYRRARPPSRPAASSPPPNAAPSPSPACAAQASRHEGNGVRPS